MSAGVKERGWHIQLAELNPNALKADGFDDACLGYAENRGSDGPVAVYSRRRCIAILATEGMSYDDAEEYFDYNVSGAYMGPNTPLFLEEWDEEDQEPIS
jgi:hypothetical protein